MKKALTDISVSIVLLVMLAVFTFQLPSVPEEGRMYPLVMLVASFGLTVAVLAGAVRSYGRQDHFTPERRAQLFSLLRNIILYIAIIAVYIFLIEKIGYLLSTLLFCAGSLLYLKCASKKIIVLLPVALTLLVYFAFTRFLMVSLPQGSWFQFYL